MQGSGEPECPAITNENFKDSQDYLFSIDLINHGYFWECHAYLEALWNSHGRKDQYSDLFKAIIKIAAGLLKYELDNESAFRIHLTRSRELLKGLENRMFCGIDVDDLDIRISHMLSKPSETIPQFFIELRI